MKSLCNLLLPLPLVLAKDLRTNFERLLRFDQQACPCNNCVRTHCFLMVVDVSCAEWAVVAVNWLACIVALAECLDHATPTST